MACVQSHGRDESNPFIATTNAAWQNRQPAKILTPICSMP